MNAVRRSVEVRLNRVMEILESQRSNLAAARSEVDTYEGKIRELVQEADELREWLDADGGIKPVGGSVV